MADKPIALSGKLYLIPTTLGDASSLDFLPAQITRTIELLDYYIVENEKTARKFIKAIAPSKVQADLKLFPLNKRTSDTEIPQMLEPCKKGVSVGLMSEAGCPGIADPGADVIALAHQNNITVVPLVGPSSILLAMMASGMNGQQFAFNGYLPIDQSDKKATIKNLERLSFEKKQSQVFIETPYRNNRMLEDLTHTLQPNTRLCVAADITLPSEFIKTKKISEWKKTKVDLHNRPCIFIIHKDI